MLQLYTLANQTKTPISVTDVNGIPYNLTASGTSGASQNVMLDLATVTDGDFYNNLASSKLTVTPLNIGQYTVPNISASSKLAIRDSLGVSQIIEPQSTKTITLTSSDATANTIKALQAQGLLGTLSAVSIANQTQSFLPVLTKGGRAVGLFAITPTAFAGTETTFTLSVGAAVPIMKITPSNQQPFLTRLPFYMAAVFNTVDEFNERWKSNSEFIPIDWVLPQTNWLQATVGPDYLKSTPGILLNALMFGNSTSISVSTTTSAPTVTTPASLAWTANAPFSSQNGIRFVDFNWVSAFAASFPTLEPAYIQITTNPGTNDVKAFVVQSGNQAANAGITQNTIRIVKVLQRAIATGVKAFTFTIYDRKGNATAVTLNLTVS